MLQRKALKQFQAWHDAPSHTALLVTGARQVGKTYLIREFADQHYESFAEFNFIQNPDAARIFNPPSDAATMLMRMELASGQRFIPGKTLIFLDEIQACKEAATAVKFLVDDGRYDFAMSGSLLGVELEDVRSVPVGYQSEVVMFPLDFEEFCWSQNVDGKIFDMLKECYEKKQPVDDFIHEHLMSLFRKYLIIGGMPAAVASFAQNNSLIDVRQAQEDIKQGYRRDISQYARKEDRLHIRSIYDLVPSELNNPNKRFTFAKIEKNTRFQAVANDFDWLVAANVAIPAYNVDEPRKPLEMSKERNLFKLFYSDVGLLTGAYLNSTALDILAGDDEVNYGAIYENVVAQELTAHGFSHLYYYNSKRLGELDFLVQDRNDNIIPIEVKSGKNYKVHRALNNVLAEESYHLRQGLVFGPGNIETDYNITYYPIYLLSQFCNN